MEKTQNVDDWKAIVAPFLDSKVKEFHVMGYTEATRDDLWQCLVEKVWKGSPDKRVYQVVQQVMHLDSAVYLGYLTNQTYQETDLMESINALVKKEEE